MTEQEITQARADLEKLGIEQLRCGVMLQLLKIEALTKERDAAMTSKDKFFDESVKHRQERDEYKQRMQRLMTTVTELKKERDFLAIANKDLSEAMENYQQLQAAAKLALDALDNHPFNYKMNPAECAAHQQAIDMLKKAGVQ